jgi:hypothetical protein
MPMQQVVGVYEELAVAVHGRVEHRIHQILAILRQVVEAALQCHLLGTAEPQAGLSALHHACKDPFFI